MATIKDVVKAAGVSIATVSATINGKAGFLKSARAVSGRRWKRWGIHLTPPLPEAFRKRFQ